MPITRDEVAHLARLSRIALSDAELDHLAPQLDQIITAVAQVQEVAAEGIPPTSHATGLTNVYRDDEPAPCLTPEKPSTRRPPSSSSGSRSADPGGGLTRWNSPA
jgi:aspartyl/glutamyl-tRNA(Asn/Gln) amidotransferase, C subunit